MGGRYVGVEEVMAEQCTGRGRRGVVVAAAPIAAGIGAEMLRNGGNAFDAAVAAALAETVLLPPKCGLAGDLVAIRLRPDAGAPEALLAIGPAPRRLGEAVVRDGGLPDTGALAVGVPGAAAGYAALAALGRLPLARLAAPAIDLAGAGVPWSPIVTVLGEESADLVARHNPAGTRYFPGGRPPAPGELVELPGLALALEEFVARGADLFAGPVGAAVAATVRAAGGVLDEEDLRTAVARWEPAARVTAHGWDLWATPAPTHGPSLLDAAALFPPGRADGASVLAAVAASAERRRATLGDPLVAAGTSMVSAADAHGNVVAVVHSNSYPRFGSGLVVDGYDLILANRAGRGFTPEPGHPNFPAPGRRPATTLHAWAAGPASAEPKATLVGGTPGGVNQVPWNAQLLASLVGGRTSPGHLVVEPRWEWSPADGSIRIEDGTSDDDWASFASAGLDTHAVERWELRSAQQVVARPRGGTAVTGAVDPRTGGLALGV
jgi:gamma-glutamyltranspeptidase/glutathione hydrolase